MKYINKQTEKKGAKISHGGLMLSVPDPTNRVERTLVIHSRVELADRSTLKLISKILLRKGAN